MQKSAEEAVQLSVMAYAEHELNLAASYRRWASDISALAERQIVETES